MAGIVLELQKNALNPDIDVVTLLRQAYLIAKKLKLAELEKWVTQELNGYDSLLPDYRKIRGEVKALNPYNGWIPVVIQNDKTYDKLCIHLVTESIPNIKSLLNSSERIAHISFQGSISSWLVEETGLRMSFALFINTSCLERITETVKNKLLEWSIVLEENGIVGEGLAFTPEEKEQAKQPQLVSYTNNFYSDVSNLQMQQGTSSSSQSNHRDAHNRDHSSSNWT